MQPPGTGSQPPSEPATSSAPDRRGEITPGRLWGAALAAGLAAGLVAWLAGEATYELFVVPGELLGDENRSEELARVQVRTDLTNASIAFGLLGLSLGAASGLVGGLARRSIRAGLTAAVGGGALGAIVAVGMSLALLPIYFGDITLADNVLVLIAIRGGIWAAVGVAGGLAFGFGLGLGRVEVARAALGGLLGAALAAVLFEFIGGFFFPLDSTDQPISRSAITRLLARLLATLLAALGVAWYLRPSPVRKGHVASPAPEGQPAPTAPAA